MLPWSKAFSRSLSKIMRSTLRAGAQAMDIAIRPAVEKHKPPPGKGDWISGMSCGPAGLRHFWLYRPPGVQLKERLPLMVMLHGCGQTAKSFAMSTHMNSVAARGRFLVLYPEQDRIANSQGCWNWFDTASGRAYGEAALIMGAIDQVCLLYGVDPGRIAIAGFSAGASMAALVVTKYPERFKAVIMHSGVPPGEARSALSAMRAMYGQPSLGRSRGQSAGKMTAWPPLLAIHGGKDHVVAPNNGHAAVQLWAEAAGECTCKCRTVQRGKRYAMTVMEFKRGRSIVATLVSVGQLGHAWSGGTAKHPYGDRFGPDASRMVWGFSARQFGRHGCRS